MNLVTVGLQLARELEEESKLYHVKSDDHEVLLWESAIVEERVYAFLEKRELKENLRDSVLTGKWGEHTASICPVLTEKVREFYSEYEKIA
jgi:hypothetical protein